MTTATDIIERLGPMQCGCELIDAIASVGRDELLRLLERYGFGRPGTAVPTDWRTYYGDEELRGFVLDYAEQFSPAA